MNTQQVHDRLIKLPEVLLICGLSRSAVYEKMKSGEFPSQVKLSKRSAAWVHSEVIAWRDGRIAERDAHANHWSRSKATSLN